MQCTQNTLQQHDVSGEPYFFCKGLYTSLDPYWWCHLAISPFQVVFLFISTWFCLYKPAGAGERAVGFRLYIPLQRILYCLWEQASKKNILRNKWERGEKQLSPFSVFPKLKYFRRISTPDVYENDSDTWLLFVAGSKLRWSRKG